MSDAALDYMPSQFIAWADEHRDFLQAIVRALAGDGAWPLISDLTHEFVRRGAPIRAESVYADMPQPLKFRSAHPERAVLSLFGLRLADGSDRFIDAYVDLVGLARSRFQADGSDARLTSTEVVEVARLRTVDGTALLDIVEREAPFLGSTTPESSAEAWVREVTTTIVDYWNADTIDDVLRLRAVEASRSPMWHWPGPESLAEAVETRLAPGADQLSVFISHAGEDKLDVARPITDGLAASGWTVWLDEYELTVGDSLFQRINDGLSRCRCGVVILSTAFFAKHWPQQELDALAAKESASGVKVILPVWHGIDERYLADVAPILAGRLGVSTDMGIANVVQQLIRALDRELRTDGEGNSRVFRSAEPGTPPAPPRVPTTTTERDHLLQTRPDLWEYLLFAGELHLGKEALEPLWYDHELRLPGGQRRHLSTPEATDFLSASFSSLTKATSQLDRILSPGVQERAFGAPGEPGDPVRIQHLAKALLRIYDELLASAAELRNQVVPDELEHPFELAAQFTDKPLESIREFIDHTVTELNRASEDLPGLEGSTEPVQILLDLTLTVDPDLTAQFEAEMRQLRGDEKKSHG